MVVHGISLMPNERDGCLRQKRIPSMQLGEEMVDRKVLGNHDNKLCFQEQMRCAADRAAKRVTALSTLMANFILEGRRVQQTSAFDDRNPNPIRPFVWAEALKN